MSEWKYVERDGWPTASGRYDLAWQDVRGARRIVEDVWIHADADELAETDETNQTARSQRKAWSCAYAWREHVTEEEPPPLEPDGEES